MATIQTAIGITDRMTPVFHTIINALDTTINTFETARSSINIISHMMNLFTANI